MKKGRVQRSSSAIDRIAANGDVAKNRNLYGRRSSRQQRHSVYVAAPLSTVDLNCPTGDDEIPIEERDIRRITHVKDIQTRAEGISVNNYASSYDE